MNNFIPKNILDRISLIPIVCTVFLVVIGVVYTVETQADPLTFKVAYASEWAPVSFGENEDVKGILPDLIDEIIARRMKIKVIHLGLPWARAQKAVENGIVDAFITTPTEQRLRYSNASQSTILQVPFRAFSLKGSRATAQLQKGASVHKLGDFLFCDVLGNGWAKSFYEARNIDYLVTSSLDNCLGMMARKRVDIIIHAAPVAQMFLRNMKLDDTIKMLPKIYPESPNFPLLLSKKSDFGPTFLKQFDHIVRSMKASGEFDRIVEEITQKNLSSP